MIFRVSTHVVELEKNTPLTKVSTMPHVLNIEWFSIQFYTISLY